MDWATLIFAIFMLVILRKRSKPKWLWVVKVFFAALAGLGLAETPIGRWLAGAFTSVFGWLGARIDAPGAALVGCLLLITMVIVVLDVAVDRKANRTAIIGLILLPVLIVAASGPVADGGSQIMAALRGLGAAGLSLLTTG